VLGTVVVRCVRASRTPKKASGALAQVCESKAAFEDAVGRTIAVACPYPTDLIDQALREYETIKQQVGAAHGQPAATAMTTYRGAFSKLMRDRATATAATVVGVNAIVGRLLVSYDEITGKVGGAPDAVQALDACKVTFEGAMRAAIADNVPYSHQAVVEARTRFSAIEGAIAASTEQTSIDALVEEAETLARRRAYVLGPAAIVQEGRARLAELTHWGIPQSIASPLERDTLPLLQSTDVNVAREALHGLLEAHDTWSWYVDRYNEKMGMLAPRLAIGVIATLAGAVVLLRFRWVVFALLVAGACGAMVSILARLPLLLPYGEATVFTRGIYRRVSVGLAGSAIGCGLLAAGIVNVGLPSNGGNFMSVVERCGRSESAGVGSGTTPANAGAGENAAHSVSTTTRPDLEAAADGPPTPKPDAEKPQSGPPADRSTPSPCTPANQLLLIALAMLFGFSERALTSFEERILPAPGGSTPT
jgi:hypothetical protein